MLADEGYSASQRRGWIKEVLTDLEMEHARSPSREREKLISKVKLIIDELQDGTKPIADDLL